MAPLQASPNTASGACNPDRRAVRARSLAHGAINQVFRAWDTRKKCAVALKVLDPYQVSETAAERQFQREIQAVTCLQHPNVVAALETGQVRGRHFLAMAYIEGIDLGKLVQLSGPLPVPQACDYIRQAALGLEHAHQRGMVHRDIKPANLLLVRGESPGSRDINSGLPTHHIKLEATTAA